MLSKIRKIIHITRLKALVKISPINKVWKSWCLGSARMTNIRNPVLPQILMVSASTDEINERIQRPFTHKSQDTPRIQNSIRSKNYNRPANCSSYLCSILFNIKSVVLPLWFRITLPECHFKSNALATPTYLLEGSLISSRSTTRILDKGVPEEIRGNFSKQQRRWFVC